MKMPNENQFVLKLLIKEKGSHARPFQISGIENYYTPRKLTLPVKYGGYSMQHRYKIQKFIASELRKITPSESRMLKGVIIFTSLVISVYLVLLEIAARAH